MVASETRDELFRETTWSRIKRENSGRKIAKHSNTDFLFHKSINCWLDIDNKGIIF